MLGIQTQGSSIAVRDKFTELGLKASKAFTLLASAFISWLLSA